MNMEVICETEPPAYRPYPFADVITKAALSPQLYKDPECWSGRSRTHDLPRDSPVLNQLSHRCTVTCLLTALYPMNGNI